MTGFIDFIRKQGVIGLAVGFIIGGAVTKLVAAIVTDVVNPLLAAALSIADLREKVLVVGEARILWGHLVVVFIDFLVVAAVVYFGVKATGLERLDKKD